MTKRGNREQNEHREQLMDYLYQEMEPERIKSFEHHLQECPMCQQDVADFGHVRQALGTWSVEDIPHISLRVDPSPRHSWFELIRTFPLWTRVVTAAAAAMLLVGLLNLQVRFDSSNGFRFSASLLPQSGAPLPAVAGVTQGEVKALIEEAIADSQLEGNRLIADQLEALATQIRTENQQALKKLARSLRVEQESRLAELMDQTQGSYAVLTLTDLFGEENGNGYE